MKDSREPGQTEFMGQILAGEARGRENVKKFTVLRMRSLPELLGGHCNQYVVSL